MVASSTTVQSSLATFCADLVAVVAGLLAVEVRLEAVPDRLVQEDAAVAGAEHDLHLAGRRFARVEHRGRLPDRLLRVPLGALAVEVAPADPAAAARSDPDWRLPFVLDDHADAEAQQRLAVADEPAVARGDQDLADLLGERGLDADDRGSSAARAARRRARGARACPRRRDRAERLVDRVAVRDRAAARARPAPARLRRRRSAPRCAPRAASLRATRSSTYA